ncbi:MAG: transcriptional regulator, AraC family [Caulobacteraceae bacterium]|nr:transcriptional regulator, AraC family [Caulobacteraceae bacterium]
MPYTNAPSRRIVLIGYPGVQSLDLVGPLEVFSMVNRSGAPVAYELILASEDGGEIICNSGLRLAGAVALADLPGEIDTILVSGGDEAAVRRARAGALPAWLAASHGRARRVGSVCSGGLVLAASGLLDGRRATTHWGFCDEFRAFRPAVKLEPDAIFVADPPFYTSAGVTAGIDLCLALVEADHGAQVALAVARNLVLFLRRAGGQAQYSAALTIQAAAASRLRKLIVEIVGEPCGDYSLPELATRAAMSERTLSRVFKQETGVSPAAFVESARIDRAKALLETSDWSLARVAERAGFGDTSGLHRAFRKKLGVTPGDYRDRFGPADWSRSARRGPPG